MLRLRSRLGIEAGAFVLFSLQRLDRLKRVDVVIEAMKQILRRDRDVCLIIGGKGPDTARLKQMAGAAGLAERIRFAGFIPDAEIPTYFQLADLFVFHSTYETFGIVLAEAMNFAKPVVSVDNTAISEVVDDGSTGILVPTGDSGALADAVLRLKQDAGLRAEMAAAGRQKAVSMFRWDRIAPMYATVLTAAGNERFGR